MKPKTIKETYELNTQLSVLYDVIDALYDKYKDKYPDDVKNDLKALLCTINQYIYHSHEGYDIVDEKNYSEITFKND